MRSLDLVNTATAHQPAPRAAMAPRARNGKAATGFRFSSCVEEAAAAAAAAAAATAAKRSAAAAAAAAEAAAAIAHAAETANGTTEQVKPVAEEPREHSVNLSVTPNVPAAAVTAATAAVALKSVADNERELAVPPVPARTEEAAADRAAAEGEHVRGSSDNLREPDAVDDITTKADQGAEQVVLNPFASLQKLARTPPTVVAPSAVEAIPCAAAAQVSKGVEAFRSSSPLEATQAAAPGAGEDRARQESPEPLVAADPFASKSRVPRTPVDTGAVSQLSHGAAMVGAGGASSEVGEMDEPTARVHIGELRQEVASMADRLAKQADEGNR